MALTDKQEVFCCECLIDLNAMQTDIRAGYRAKAFNRTFTIMGRVSAVMMR